jgi:hypothetical protein
VEITTNDAANRRPVIRHYDLGYIQSDSKNLAAIIATIEQAVEPDTWSNSGGYGSIMPIGQLLVVSTTEKAHLGIEKLLYRLSPQSAVQPGKPANTMLGGGEVFLHEDVANIVGTVTFRGKPIVARLSFHYEGSITSFDSWSDGEYRATLTKGNYAITLDGKDVPAKYRTVADSPLKYKVESGRNLFDITLDDSPNNLVSISGVVTRRGKPLVADIGFHSSGMKPFTTTTSNDGTYVLKSVPMGSYKITLNGNGVAPKYQNVEQSPLTFEVDKGGRKFEISID